MNKRRRKQLGLAGHRREDVWRLMAAQEARLLERAAAETASSPTPAPWWRRLLLCLLRLLAHIRRQRSG
jgi:hypothetical protein